MRYLALTSLAVCLLATPGIGQQATLKKLFRHSASIEDARVLDSFSSRATRSLDEVPTARGVRTTGLDADSAVAILRAAGHSLDPDDLRALRALDGEALDAVVTLEAGARRLREGIPDISLRTRCLHDGGPGLLQAVGRYPELTDDVLRLESMLSTGMISPAPSGVTATLADLGRFASRTGTNGIRLLREKIWPNRKALAAAGVLSWILIDSDQFLDTAGELTEAGAKILAEAGGSVVAGAVEGVSSGADAAIADVKSAAANAARRGVGPVLAVVAAGVAILAFFFRRVRRLVLAPIRWLRVERSSELRGGDQ